MWQSMKKQCLNLIRRLYSTELNVEPKICIIGAGPAGFYAARHLVKHVPSIKVDIYEKLPVPFGLVRFGVAPDHPEVKNVINTFTKTAENKNVNFIGNVALGRDIQLVDLKEAYHVILLAYGAAENRKLNITGENLKNVFPARHIVGWYNGVPEDSDLNIDLSHSTAAIIGQGNVAIDVARILLTPIDLLKKTDITQKALAALAKSKINEIYLIGRRGPLNIACTIKELREMINLHNCATVWNPRDFPKLEGILSELPRPRKRLTELMLKSLHEEASEPNTFKPKFFRSPLEFMGTSAVDGVKLNVNDSCRTCSLPPRTAKVNTEIIKCGLAITSIGYKSVQVDPGIPFDINAGVAKNINGKISDGLYATGWVATGPRGVILTTMSNAFGMAKYIIHDLQKQVLTNKAGFVNIQPLLNKKGVQVVYWENWLKIDAHEREEGAKLGKPREKITNIETMLKVAE